MCYKSNIFSSLEGKSCICRLKVKEHEEIICCDAKIRIHSNKMILKLEHELQAQYGIINMDDIEMIDYSYDNGININFMFKGNTHAESINIIIEEYLL
ncbi:hypothetical protein SAMN02745975_01884 [Geosporobacter subterraneus DSM 17957]|uniref:Uncharacterized protein n=1 Tax=Geosporobacter subterraneus DSM 17957 TaxID=1121919 RepID=A0A1M6IJ77_9FIRM|nr:hypothetical protein [Geosporobacter subterraneus]SHJ34532.1 hypothetical protein SAMN02745975_01884 [Geosporobacter subterraneus DSM 17957]